MTEQQIEEELLKLDIFERFENDVSWLIRLYDSDNSLEKWAEIRSWLIQANPRRSASIAPSDG